MDSTKKNKTVEVAMEVILHAGKARDLVSNALNSAYAEDFANAGVLIAQAEDEARAAHRLQTTTIQSEANGEEVSLSLLLIHAQDTLMVSMSEINMAKHMIRFAEKGLLGEQID